MVSTFASLDLVNRDMRRSIQRIQSQSEIERETAYFKENISKVSTVDEFLGDYRLYSYAMKSFGLEDMIYAKAFMKKVLESDLTDSSSFAMRLSDDKYRNFATAFKFSSSTLAAQTSSQEDAAIKGYDQWLANEEDNANTEAGYFKAMIGSVTSVDDLLSNDRLYTFALKSLDIDPTYASRSFIKDVLTSDTSDPNSFVNQLTTYKETYLTLANSFNFNTSGTLDVGVSAQDASQTKTMTDNYILNVPSYITQAGALINMDYIRDQMATVTNVSDITGNTKLFGLVKVALGLNENMLKSQFENIVTSDTSVSGNYAKTFGGDAWVEIADMFNFDTSGNVNSTAAMSDANLETLTDYYSGRYNDKQDAAQTDLYEYYHTNMDFVDSVDELFTFPKLYDLALKSVGIDPDETSEREVRRVLTSDLNDPLSFVNRMNDDRFVQLTKAFNFDENGEKRAPFIAQSESEILKISRDYVFLKSRFAEEGSTARDDAKAEAEYYSTAIEGVNSLDDFLSNSRLVNFVLEAKDIDPKDISKETLKKLFTSDLEDPDSFVNTYSDTRFVEIVSAFNFDQNGNLANMDKSNVQGRGSIYSTIMNYYHQSLEEEAGLDNTGVRLALYFERQAPKIDSAFDILGDPALLQVFKTAFSLPDEFSAQDIDIQAKMVEKYLTLSDLADQDKLQNFIQRFTALYDLQNSETNTVSLFSRGGGISANTLYTLSQLKLS